MKIEIVSHCWRYAKMLNFQLSSLALHPPEKEHAVIYTLCFTPTDVQTERVRRYYQDLSIPGVSWNWMAMPERLLNRRAIGRNLAALATGADWVWFADVDYCFGEVSFENLAQRAAKAKGPLIFPECVRATTKEGGDELLAQTPSTPAVRGVPPEYWSVDQRFGRAIGGVQITRGEVCRELGYLRDSPRWQEGADVWQGCREDPHFRRMLGTAGQSIDLPGVFRIRHNAKGRYDPTVNL